ncbi:MAG: septal ring lytic transglycosylase RlpA family protein [Syntrophales bacterium]
MEVIPAGTLGEVLSQQTGVRRSAGKESGSFSAVLTASLDAQQSASVPVKLELPPLPSVPEKLDVQQSASVPAKPESPSGDPGRAGTEPVEYIVKKGDTLWKIGRQLFHRDPYQIARDNGLANPNLIRPGQKLLIHPAPPRPAPPQLKGEVTASWYGAEHHDKLTASGQRFDMHKNTLAHRTLPLGTKVRLVNPANGRSAEAVVNDRGPYIKGRDVDVSYGLAKQLGFVRKGVTKLDIETI